MIPGFTPNAKPEAGKATVLHRCLLLLQQLFPVGFLGDLDVGLTLRQSRSTGAPGVGHRLRPSSSRPSCTPKGSPKAPPQGTKGPFRHPNANCFLWLGLPLLNLPRFGWLQKPPAIAKPQNKHPNRTCRPSASQNARGLVISRRILGCVMSLLNITPSSTCKQPMTTVPQKKESSEPSGKTGCRTACAMQPYTALLSTKAQAA